MPEKKSGDEQAQSEAQPASSEDLGAEQVAERLHAEQEQGYSGSVPDPTPNHAYTVAGVTAGEPTPETDEELRNKARGGEKR